MKSIVELSGKPLEESGKKIIERLGLKCIGNLDQAKLIKLFPKEAFTSGEHIEFDYLVPHGTRCYVGEITSRSILKDVKTKLTKFAKNVALFNNANFNKSVWTELGVPKNKLSLFRTVRELHPFFMLTNFEYFDFDANVASLPIFYRTDLRRLEDYSASIGQYGESIFLQAFPKRRGKGKTPLVIDQEDHGLIFSCGRRITSDEEGLADVFTFEISPYELLRRAQVFRNDSLPSLSDANNAYQRPLIPKKLANIREHLLCQKEFIFPSSVLVVLNSRCMYDQTSTQLTIVDEPSAVTVIDGQHRLFSYADEQLYEAIHNDAQILVTAIKFDTDEDEKIFKCSAKAFVEINSNQTSIDSTHIDSIAYDILGESTPRAISAKVLIELNNRKRKPFFGLFRASYTNFGLIQSKTILAALSPMLNIERIKKDIQAREGTKSALRFVGYTNLMKVENSDSLTSEVLFIESVKAIERYGSLVKKVFPKDWPVRNKELVSILGYSKMMAALIRLFREFVAEGADWDKVEKELLQIKKSVVKITGSSADQVCFPVETKGLPTPTMKQSEMLEFLMYHRHA